MRIDWDTPVDTLKHGCDIRYIDLDDDEIAHWKYVKREKLSNGKWRYYYDWNELKNNTKKAIDSVTSGVKKSFEDTSKNFNALVNKGKTNVKNMITAVSKKTEESILKSTNEATKKIDGLVDKAKTFVGKVFNDPKNQYDITNASYTEKMSKIKESEEWQNIVKRKDPEYVKKNTDGSTTYLVDDYIVDKKHPVLDALSDIVAGRKVTVNKITKESTIAGLKDYAMGALRTGMLALGISTTFLNEKFKLQQGTYDEQISQLTETAQRGANYVENWLGSTNGYVDTVNKRYNDASATAKTVTGVLSSVLDNASGTSVITKSSVEKLMTNITNSDVARTVNDGKIVQAAQLIMQSSSLQRTLGSNKYYKLAEETLANLSPEEIEALNLLLKQIRP